MSGLWASMASWWPQWQAFTGFAWPWAWLALPLPLLARWGLPPRRADDVPALRVPWGDRLAKVADGAPADVMASAIVQEAYLGARRPRAPRSEREVAHA